MGYPVNNPDPVSLKFVRFHTRIFRRFRERFGFVHHETRNLEHTDTFDPMWSEETEYVVLLMIRGSQV